MLVCRSPKKEEWKSVIYQAVLNLELSRMPSFSTEKEASIQMSPDTPVEMAMHAKANLFILNEKTFKNGGENRTFYTIFEPANCLLSS